VVSLDYFSINIVMLDTPPAQTILDQCYSGFSQACSSITRGATPDHAAAESLL